MASVYSVVLTRLHQNIHKYKDTSKYTEMAKELLLVGGNLVQDTGFRKRLGGRDAGTEVQLVVEDLLDGWTPPDGADEVNQLVIGRKEETEIIQKPNREQLKVTLKIFLSDFNLVGLREAVKTALQRLDTDHVETIFVAVPVSAMALIGVGSGTTPDQATAVDEMVTLWKEMEVLLEEGKVGTAGVCDLQPSVFISLYEKATRKPDSVQINLKSCCVIPEDLSTFTKENKVTLLTHSDPAELLNSDTLRSALYPSLGREAGHYNVDWVARYQVHYKDRGILLEKRYLVNLAK